MLTRSATCVIDSPDNKPEDNAGAIENDPAPEQSARTSGRVFMNSIVSAASLAAAAKIAAPSLAEAETPANLIAVAVSVEPDPIYAATSNLRKHAQTTTQPFTPMITP